MTSMRRGVLAARRGLFSPAVSMKMDLSLFARKFLCQPRADVRENLFRRGFGVDAYEVEIEVNSAGGLPAIVVVGLPDAAVKESKDRVTTAISNIGYYWPRGRTTVNLAPADIKKEGPSFDLPIALGMIACSLETDTAEFSHYSF